MNTFRHGGLLCAERITVASFTINPKFQSSEFHFDLTPGSIVEKDSVPYRVSSDGQSLERITNQSRPRYIRSNVVGVEQRSRNGYAFPLLFGLAILLLCVYVGFNLKRNSGSG
jgi:hypothetical protein